MDRSRWLRWPSFLEWLDGLALFTMCEIWVFSRRPWYWFAIGWFLFSFASAFFRDLFETWRSHRRGSK